MLARNNWTVVASDKTNRLVITNEASHLRNSANMLTDPTIYKFREVSKHRSIEQQGNKLMKTITQNSFTKSDQMKLITAGGRPAKFRTVIKDHKAVDNETGTYPLRPISSTKNTPTDKIDWLISKILNQLTKFVPAHLRNTDELLTLMNSLDNLNDNDIFLSLDVKNLYPSIPIEEAIKCIVDFAEEHWHLIDTLQVTKESFRKGLSFISHNYEVSHNGRTYLQIKGCPMGSHFSPPFAIIFMHKIEKEALRRIEEKYDIIPTI